MQELHLPWLELTILTPLLGAMLVGFISDAERARKLCLVVCLLSLGFALGEWLDFGTLHTFEAHDHWDVVDSVFHRDLLVVDELSAPLLPLAALMYLMTVLSTLKTKVRRFSFGWTLVSETILLTTFCCRSPWAIVVLLSLATVPPWVELRGRGRCTRVYSLHMGAFVCLLWLGQSISSLGGHNSSCGLASGVLLTLATLLRSGVFPLHCWMSDLFDKATFGTALLFVTPMTGAYAVLRLVLPIADDWVLHSIALFSLFTAVYSAGLALVQTDARRFFCYLLLSHSSLVLVGLELMTPIGLTGALCVWLSVALSLAGFAITLRCIEARIGRISLKRFHGLYEHTPTLAALFLLTGLASIGFPGTIGFIGAELLVDGAIGVFPVTGTAVIVATALNGIAVLNAYFRIFTGTTHISVASLKARPEERIAVLVLVVLILGGGLFPQWGVASRYHAAMALISRRDNAQVSPPPAAPLAGNSGSSDKEHDSASIFESLLSENKDEK